MEAGLIYMYGGSTAPNGFLICDGSEISRTTYSSLFAAIGTIYGAGDNSTTFNIPNISGRVAIGSSVSHNIGMTGGEETHTLLTNEMPAHSHTIPAHGHTHTIKATTPKLVHSITQPMFKYNPPSGGQRSSFYHSGTKDTTNANTTTAASRSANLAIANHSATACTKTGSITDCSVFDFETAGSGSSHNNMQPYITLNYIISIGD